MPPRMRTLVAPALPDKVVEDNNSTYDGAPYALNPVALPPEHPQWVPPPPDPGSASPGDSFTEATVTAEDATNAAKLGPLGYVADPATAWTTGQHITVSTFRFFWDAAAWQPGAAP